MSRIEDLVKKEIAITVGTSDIKYIESIDIKNIALTRIAEQVAKEIFDELEHKIELKAGGYIQISLKDYNKIKEDYVGEIKLKEGE